MGLLSSAEVGGNGELAITARPSPPTGALAVAEARQFRVAAVGGRFYHAPRSRKSLFHKRSKPKIGPPMLQSLRHQASSWIVKILFGFLILSFGLWGINDIFVGERDPAVATVSGTKITLTQLNDAVRQEVARFQPLFGGTLDREQARQLGLVDQALDRLIDGAVFANATRDFGLAVNEEMIRRHILREPSFRDARGEFDRNLFQQVLSQNGLTEGSYVTALRRDLPSTQIIDSITATSPAPAVLIDALHRYREEGRIAETVLVPAAQSSTPPVPDDAVIAEHYKADIERFMTPEMRVLSYVLIDPAALARDIALSDERLKEEYDNNIGEFTVREKRDLDQAVFASEADALRAAALLDKGTPLADAVKQVDAKATVVPLGMVERTDLLNEIADAAFALKPGQHSAPVKSPLGWHLLVIKTIEEGRVKPFAEVREALRETLADYAAANQAHDTAIRLEDALAAGATLEDASARAGLTMVRLPPVDSNGRTAEGKPAADLVNDPRFIRAAFSTPQGQESQLLELPQNRFAIVAVDQIVPPGAKPLDTVKNDVIASWQAQQRMDAARARASAIADRVNKGETLAAVAAAENLPVATTAAVTRAGRDEQAPMPEPLKAQLFDLKLGGAAFADTPDGYMIAALKEIRPAPALAPGARTELVAQLSRAMGEDLLDQLAVALRARYDIEIKRDIINSRL